MRFMATGTLAAIVRMMKEFSINLMTRSSQAIEDLERGHPVVPYLP